MTTLSVTGRALGSSKPLFADWAIEYPPELPSEGGRLTLRDLITRVVRAEVDAFRHRQADRQVIRALTARQIQAGAERGKVDMGGHDLAQRVDAEASVGAALQAFEDGLYLVIIDEQQHRELDGEVHLRPDSRITFLRLTMLAGG